MELLAMSVTAGCGSITPFAWIGFSSSLSTSSSSTVSVQNGFRSSFLPETHQLHCAGLLRNEKTSERFVVRSIAARDRSAERGWDNSSRSSVSCRRTALRVPVIARRQLMGNVGSLILSWIAFPAVAASENGSETGYVLYQDDTDKYSLLVPQEWVKGEGNTTERSKNSQRKVTAFYPENDISANVNIIITGLAADYTSLGSFGTAEMFAENLVNSLDRSWQKPPGQKARLINDSSRNGMYYVEYTVQKPGERQRHLLTVIGMANNGWYNRLFTVTAQYTEDDSDKYEARLKKIVSSFRFTG